MLDGKIRPRVADDEILLPINGRSTRRLKAPEQRRDHWNPWKGWMGEQRMDEWKSFDLIIGEVLDQEKI